MTDDQPGEVYAALARSLLEAADCARSFDTAGTLDGVDSVERTVDEELSADDLADQLRHGCAEVRTLAEDDPVVAAEYLDAMRRRLEDRRPE